ncbi:hypothetical protein HMPREF0262_00070 [Clostridium sp. ATCC 29733]|nr:hypothetical protein HMPREF0262_00070 [Clostridium sp. ATCC 29733]
MAGRSDRGRRRAKGKGRKNRKGSALEALPFLTDLTGGYFLFR